MITVAGWYETDTGVETVQVEGPSMMEIASRLNQIDPDIGFTDMEFTDQDGKDVTGRLYRILDRDYN